VYTIFVPYLPSYRFSPHSPPHTLASTPQTIPVLRRKRRRRRRRRRRRKRGGGGGGGGGGEG
jgi:hypothetical protein